MLGVSLSILITAEFAGAELKVKVEEEIVNAVVAVPSIYAFIWVLSINGKVIEYCVVLPLPV